MLGLKYDTSLLTHLQETHEYILTTLLLPYMLLFVLTLLTSIKLICIHLPDTHTINKIKTHSNTDKHALTPLYTGTYCTQSWM